MSEIGAPLDFTICVDRSFKPTYPEWVKGLMHPELELKGPDEYDLRADVERYLHDEQHQDPFTPSASKIYSYLKDTELLTSCLNLQDGLAIQQKGVATFRELFGCWKKLYLYASVVMDVKDHLHVPFIFGDKIIVIRWLYMESSNLHTDHQALRFRPPVKAGRQVAL